MQILNLLSVADEKVISDIVFGTDDGIDIIHTWYLPDISIIKKQLIFVDGLLAG